MKILLISYFGFLFLASCSRPAPAPVPKAVPVLEPTVTLEASPEAQPKVEPAPLHSLKARTINTGGTELTIVSFDRRIYRLVVEDQPSGPGSQYDDAKDAGSSHLAAINGGFFTPTGSPLGLVVTEGTRRGGINRASFLGTGFFLGPEAELTSRIEYLASPPRRKEVLQSGPRLVWAGETLTGLSNKEERPRSFLLWDGREHFALGYADSASLKGLSNILSGQPISGFNIAYALNLDGGRSSDLWVSSSVSGGELTRRSFFNKDVRNYLVLKKRQ